MKLKPLDQQVIVITGASSGIGLVTARRAAAAGAKVMLVSRDADALAEAAAGIGEAAAWHAADVADAGAVREAAAEAVKRWGRIDSWVNCAGVTIYGALLGTPEDEHRQLFDTNYFGTVNGCLAAVQHLRGRGGALITVASIVADIPSPVQGAYAASKHAVKAYVEALRIELSAAGLPVSVSLVKPSGIDTPVAEHAPAHVGGKALLPPPVYDPELVADAILACAVEPRREVTVGGAGRAQVLFAQHFKGLFEKLAPFYAATMVNPSQPQPAEAGNGRERSEAQSGRRTSLYTAAALHPRATAAVGLAGMALAGVLIARRSKDG
jgi:short-subunit dehydrogenase